METNERWMAEEIVDFSSTVVSNVIGIPRRPVNRTLTDDIKSTSFFHSAVQITLLLIFICYYVSPKNKAPTHGIKLTTHNPRSIPIITLKIC